MFGLISKKKMDSEVKILTEQISTLNDQIADKDIEIRKLKNDVILKENENVNAANYIDALKEKIHEMETSKGKVCNICDYADIKHLVDDAPCRAITAIENIKTQTDLISDKVNIKAVNAVKAIIAEFYNH